MFCRTYSKTIEIGLRLDMSAGKVNLRWYREKGSNRLKAVYVDTVLGKDVAVPRRMIKHLDGESDINVKYQMAIIAEKMKITDQTHKHGNQITEPKIRKFVDQYESHLMNRGKSKRTIDQHKQCLLQYALPFLCGGENPKWNPNFWPGNSVKLLDYLQDEKGLNANYIRIVNSAVRGFWTWLQDEGVIDLSVQLRLRSAIGRKTETPLPRTVEPEEVLAFIMEKGPSSQIAIVACLGYFFSLRPFEIFGLKKTDFAAGSKVQGLECIKLFSKNSLYSRLAVKIERQRNETNVIKPPKSNSTGWVACFNEEVAKIVVGYLNGLESSELIFQENVHTYSKRWKKEGLANITMKDLRRSSLYYLGHHTGLANAPTVLQKHARHKNLKTTQLYLRRPEEEVERATFLDLGA